MSHCHNTEFHANTSVDVEIVHQDITIESNGDTVITMELVQGQSVDMLVDVHEPATIEVVPNCVLTQAILDRLAALEAGGVPFAESIPDEVAYSADYSLVYVGRTDTDDKTPTSAIWQIYRYHVASNTWMYADGDEQFDNIWSDREVLTYS